MSSSPSRPRLLLLAIALLASLLVVISPPAAQAQTDEFDTAEPTIINGTPVEPYELPYLVVVASETGRCTGVLVDAIWVLTAAHCTVNIDDDTAVVTPQSPPELLVGVGGINFGSAEQVVGVSQIVRNPSALLVGPIAQQRGDIALLRLTESANLRNPYIGLAVIDESSDLGRPGDIATVSGFGATNPQTGSEPADTALKSTVSLEDCAAFTIDGGRLNNTLRICDEDMVLSGSCNGDSGGPLVQQSGGIDVVIGIVEGGVTRNNSACGTPGLDFYTRVSAYAPWIRSVIGEQMMCEGRPVEHFVTPGVTFSGTAGHDVILGTDGDDKIFGLGSDDVICGRDGRDIIRGGAGHDLVRGGLGVDKIFGGTGRDELHGDGGSDRIWGQGAADTIRGGSGADRIWGGDANDDIGGMGGKDTLYGEAGDDTIQGNSQSDTIFGGPGNDTLRGADGKDKIYGGPGNDQMFGGKNTDFLTGQDGTDHADGQQGKDNPFVLNVSGCVAETKKSC